MWPLNLYTSAERSFREGGVALAHSGWIDTYQALAPAERAIGQFVVTLLFATIVIGMIQGYGTSAVTKSRRSPIISICIGLPSVFIVGALAGTGYLILGTSLGTFFGLLFLVLGLTTLPAGTVVGAVAIGQSIATRLGRPELWAGVLIGSLAVGLAGYSIPMTVALVGFAATLGTGALIRVLFGFGGISSPDERTVPPANKV
ncbi:hypothetical protein [Natrarchaeobaculum sulfurireducens]|uniref:Uncharacterized protein n=1 Tax=Natrarchaeobaculum sulfurireducens TaxID=2044521 RepID=A0A346PQP9_9EURY|nr:hypothetical protein [Natrarchaeobaculum sulfurireducens]AXR81844.1 hypothetical protein AArcMg_1837 [Natrarchaeobaculum sulfurireducens]